MLFRKVFFILLLAGFLYAERGKEIFVGMLTDVGYIPYNSDVRGTTMVFTTQGTFVVFGEVKYRKGDGAWLTVYEDNQIFICIQNTVIPDKVQYFRLTKKG